jgi:hypothetical protein
VKYAGLGLVVGLIVGPMVGVPSSSLWVSAVIGAMAVYVGSCLVFPYRRCPWCKDGRRRSDGDGNWRERNCPVCQDEPYVRFGARLMGRGR